MVCTELASLSLKKKNRQNKLPLPFVQIRISPFLLQLETCLLPYSNSSVCSSEYISSYLILSLCHFPIFIFSLQFSLAPHTRTWSSISLSFLKRRNALDLTRLSTSSSPFFLSLNPLNKLLTMCVGFLSPKSFLSTLQPNFPPLHLFSENRSCQDFRWSPLMGTTQPGHHLSPVLPLSLLQNRWMHPWFFSLLYACMTGTFLLEHGGPGFDFY